MPDQERPYVDEDVQGTLATYLNRVLEHATPESWTGPATEDEVTFTAEPRNHKSLKNREAIYQAGGPVTSIIDSRSLMTFGVGLDFETESLVTDDLGRTVDEYLADEMGDWLDLFLIDAGIQSYWAGDAWPEIVETRGGDFSHLNLIDPTTVDPQWDRHGEFTALRQVIKTQTGFEEQLLDLDDVYHLTHSNATGGPLGESLIARNHDEIKRFAKNQIQRANAIRLHGSPHYHVRVGSDGQSISDKLVRRVRNMFDTTNTDEKTNWVTGGMIEIDELDTPGFEGMSSITETDARMLAWAFDFPLEWTNFGSAGLGDGTPAQSRMLKFERQARAQQSRFSVVLVDIIRDVLDRYSPFPRDVDLSLRWGDVVSDQQATADWLSQVGWAFHRDEVRELMDHAAWADDGDREAPPELAPDVMQAEGGGGGGIGGLLNQRATEDAPDPLAGDDAAKRAHTDGGRLATPDRQLLHNSVGDDALTQEELVWSDIYDRVLWSDETDRALFEFDPEEVPEFVVARLRDAVAGGALFDDFEGISPAAASQIEDALLDSLETQHGWSINSLRDNLMEAVPGLDDPHQAERIARTETQALVNQAREDGYREEFDVDEERFKWVGPSDRRTTETCEAIKDRVGDEGVSLTELQDVLAEEARARGHEPRDWTPHINCRHTYVRVV